MGIVCTELKLQNAFEIIAKVMLFVSMGFSFKAFNPDNEYHFKNRMKVCQRNWAEVFGEGNMHAVSPISTFQKVSMALKPAFRVGVSLPEETG